MEETFKTDGFESGERSKSNYFMYSIFLSLGSSDFQFAFWAEFFAALVTGLIFAFWFNRATNLFKVPRLKMVVKQNGVYRDTILLSTNKSGDFIATFQLAIKNEGNFTIKPGEGYWHTYILEKGDKPGPHAAPGENSHQRDLIAHPLLPNSFTDIDSHWNFVIAKAAIDTADIPYFFSTDYGYFPRSVRIDQNTGVVQFATMGKIGYELPA